jgi:1-acyl-sn-glycerol-3-phosphate acyltransferase
MNGLILFWLHLWCGTRFNVKGLENLTSIKQAIIVANHESMFDIPLILWFLRMLSPQFIAKQELGKYLPSISFLLRNMGSLMINRSDKGGALASIRNYGVKASEKDQSVVIFPEGTRARDGKMKRFKYGGTQALIDTMKRAAVIPVTINNSYKIVKHNLLPIPWRIDVNMIVHSPLWPEINSQEVYCNQIEAMIRSGK